jgi:hypothetical protein
MVEGVRRMKFISFMIFVLGCVPQRDPREIKDEVERGMLWLKVAVSYSKGCVEGLSRVKKDISKFDIRECDSKGNEYADKIAPMSPPQ